jgi:PEP-CTERM motif
MNRLALAAFAAAALVAGAARASSIDIAPDGDTYAAWGPSASGVQSYGQVFTAPDAYLVDYALTVGGDPFNFVSQVFAWDGSNHTVGAALYTSAVEVVPATDTTFTFSPGITLTAGAQYIALVTPDPGGVALGGFGYAQMASGVAASGFYYAEGDPTQNWSPYRNSAAFHADFSQGGPQGGAVPEPATWSMMILGLGAAGSLLRRRRATAIA